MELHGTITEVQELRTGTNQQSGAQWKRQNIIVAHGSAAFPKKVVLDVNPDRFTENGECILRRGLKGIFHLDIDAREYNGRMYNSVSCYRYEPYQSTQAQAKAPAQAPAAEAAQGKKKDSNLPF